MKLIHVKDNTYCIDAGMSYIPFYKLNEKDIILLDTGAIDEKEILEEVFEQNNLNVKGIICSHGHPDHVGNNQYFKQKYKCPIAMPAFEAQIYSSAMNMKVLYGNITLTDVERYYGYLIFETDECISVNQNKINLCGAEFKITHTPGHSTSHICITTPDDVCYLADAIIGYELMEAAKIPFDFVLLEGIKSREKLRSLTCSKYIATHKGIYDNIDKLITDNIEFYKYRAEKICELITEKMTVDEIMQQVLKAFAIRIDSVYKFEIIRRMLNAFIDYLYETGRLRIFIEDGLLKYERIEYSID